MSENDDGLTPPRHRKTGRASKRGTGLPGRHLRVVVDNESDPGTYPPGAYPVDDLAAMSVSAIEMLVHRASVEAASGVAACPHIVITRDAETGVATYSGPFDTGLEALTTARDFVGKYRDLNPPWEFSLTVAPQL